MRSTAGWRGTWNVAVMIDDVMVEFELGLAALYSQYSHALGHTRYTRQNVVAFAQPGDVKRTRRTIKVLLVMLDIDDFRKAWRPQNR